MSEIDVSKCEDFEKATCFDNDFDEIEFDYCKLFDEPCEDVRNNNRCTYKLKQQIQQLKAENDELKKKLKTIYDILDMCENGNCSDCKYEDCNDCTSLNHNDVLQLIKQTKGEQNVVR